MNISKQLKNYRKEFKVSQEELAEVIHVSRQTISNWENNKSYPDLQSLLLLSDYFKISLDELVKGDIIEMKNDLERKKFTSTAYAVMISLAFMFVCIIIAEKLNSSDSIIVGIVAVAPILYFAHKAERFKKNKNIRTYSEILNYLEGKESIKTRVVKSRKKIVQEDIMKSLDGAVIGMVLAYILLNII